MAETFESALGKLTAMRAAGQINAEEFSLAKKYLAEEMAGKPSPGGKPTPPKAPAKSAEKSSFGALKTVAGVFAIGWLLYSWGTSGSTDPAKSTREAAISKCFSAWDGSNADLVKKVKDGLRDPDSFEHIGTHYTDKGSYLRLVMKYRAKNGFGGYNVEYADGTCAIN